MRGNTTGHDKDASQPNRNHLAPVPSATVGRPIISVDYLRRLGWWVYHAREDAHESRYALVAAMQRAGLDFSMKTLRTIESYRELGEDAPAGKMLVNLGIVKFLAQHYGTTLAKLDTYLDGGEEPISSDQEILDRLFAQMDSGRREYFIGYAHWLIDSAAARKAFSSHSHPVVANTADDDLLRRIAAEQAIEQARQIEPNIPLRSDAKAQNGTSASDDV